MSGWVGWAIFAAIIMILLGIFHAVAGLVALFKQNYYFVTRNGLALSISFTTWGWVHLILGVFVALAGFAIIRGRTWGQVVGVVLAGLSAIINLVFLAAYPVGSTILIAIDFLVIYALVVHGPELKPSS